VDSSKIASKSRLPGFASVLLHVFVLWNLAFCARLYAVLEDEPVFFLGRRSGALDLPLFVLILSVMLPGLLAAVVWLAGRDTPS